jgi:tetratricopeptide (TPR) repeat protein
MPLLETRFALQRKRFPLAGLPHLDFLFSARHLWKHRYESCRLSHLAREIVRADRDEDIPGAEIPIRYFQYIRSGDFSLIEPILYHNQEDILSLLGVVIEGALLFDRGRRPSQDETDAMDLVGIGRLYESAGDLERSIELFEKALEGKLSGEVSVHIRTKLGRHFKKNRAWDKAVSLWKGAAGCDELSSRRELAMYFEHKEKNYEEAIRTAEEGLAWAMGVSLQYEQDFRKRLERLTAKVRRRQEKSKK